MPKKIPPWQMDTLPPEAFGDESRKARLSDFQVSPVGDGVDNLSLQERTHSPLDNIEHTDLSQSVIYPLNNLFSRTDDSIFLNQQLAELLDNLTRDPEILQTIGFLNLDDFNTNLQDIAPEMVPYYLDHGIERQRRIASVKMGVDRVGRHGYMALYLTTDDGLTVSIHSTPENGNKIGYDERFTIIGRDEKSGETYPYEGDGYVLGQKILTAYQKTLEEQDTEDLDQYMTEINWKQRNGQRPEISLSQQIEIDTLPRELASLIDLFPPDYQLGADCELNLDYLELNRMVRGNDLLRDLIHPRGDMTISGISVSLRRNFDEDFEVNLLLTLSGQPNRKLPFTRRKADKIYLTFDVIYPQYQETEIQHRLFVESDDMESPNVARINEVWSSLSPEEEAERVNTMFRIIKDTKTT